MSLRRFAVPLVALGLTTTAATGCGIDPLIGTWLLTAIEADGEDYSYLFDGYSETYGGCTYTGRIELTLEFEADDRDGDEFEGEFVQTYHYSYVGDCDDESYSESYSYDVAATREDRRQYDIEVDDLDWDVDCAIEDDVLDCEGDASGADLELTFELQ